MTGCLHKRQISEEKMYNGQKSDRQIVRASRLSRWSSYKWAGFGLRTPALRLKASPNDTKISSHLTIRGVNLSPIQIL